MATAPDGGGRTPPKLLYLGLALIAIAAVVTYEVVQLRAGSPAIAGDYYTVDDGASLFKGDPNAVPPFDHGGRPAVRARVYTCGGKQFVAYLERYTPHAKGVLDRAEATAKATPSGERPNVNVGEIRGAQNETEVKRPADAQWVAVHTAAGRDVTNVKCPGGGSDEPIPVRP